MRNSLINNVVLLSLILLVSGCVVWMVANVVVDLQRSLVWKDNQTLMLHDAAVQPRCVSLQVKAATMHHWLSLNGHGDGHHRWYDR